jgi:hypothetical protein
MRCKARVEPNPEGYWGRCDLRRRHSGDHELERGFYHFRWSTRWTRIDPGPGMSSPPLPYPPEPRVGWLVRWQQYWEARRFRRLLRDVEVDLITQRPIPSEDGRQEGDRPTEGQG